MNQHFHIKIGDRIKIISGQQKGLIGNILSLNKKQNLVTIDSLNPRQRYYSQREKQREVNKPTETDKKSIPIKIHVSNLMLWDIQSNQASRIGYKNIETQNSSNVLKTEKKRYFKKSGNIL